MGNCGSNPNTSEGPEPVPVSVTEEVKVEQATEEALVEDNKTLNTLLNEVEGEEMKAEPKEEESKTEEVKVQEEKPKIEETKIEA
ncbi:hypothetical protein TSUD_83660 [Trifolium subterraneum]|uniref:EKN n=1 Tax=Trifolium subterraneum TaxID=3900 RepID=A0A2Z6LXA2_TRISU|nr:hypothetical protein TSUD_83660 [Trifolium subterraneum]